MDAPRTSIDHAVRLLFRAIAASAQGDRLTVVDARSELVAIAATTEDFEAQLTTAIVDRLVPSFLNATRDEIEQAVRVDISRHVTNPIFLAKIEPWGRA
jgi:hypothetical protein